MFLPVGNGYSGHGAGRNNPEMQNIRRMGPIPRGLYAMKEPEDTVAHGPYVIRLAAKTDNEMFGRDGFLIRGDSIKDPGQEGAGCIVLSRMLRRLMWESGDHLLEITE